MADVARHAGVSVKTVSNVLSGYPYIRETTRERVLASVDALGYEINVTARILRSGRSGVIGLAVPELGQPYFGELADEVLEAARRHGLHVVITPTGFTREGELAALREPRRGLIDGLVFSPAALEQSDAHLLDALGYPLVLLGEQIFSPSVDHVTMRNIDGARAATDLLLDVGRRRIAVIGMLHAETAGSASLRHAGYSQALEARGIGADPRLLGWADDGWHRGNGARAMAGVLDSGVQVDGVVAFNDALAIGAMYELQARGLAIPGDVAVVGFDDIEDARYSVPALTTVDPGRREIANVAVDILSRRVREGREPDQGRGAPVLYLAGMRLVERESTPRRAAVRGASHEPDSIGAFREGARQHAARQPRALAHLPLGTFDRVGVGDAPVPELMVYRPTDGPDGPDGSAAPALPGVYLNLHGGGFVLGDWQPDDPYCRYLADEAGCVVVNLDYLLAPEHPFPAAVHQVAAVLEWLAEHASQIGADASRIVVGGHSAGGNLAAAACLLAARRGGPRLSGLLVDYAPLDLATPPSSKLPDDGTADAGALAFASVGERFNAWYLPTPDDASDELASPLLAADLSGMPPTLVITAEHDLLRAEGDRFADRVRSAGVGVEHVVVPESGHGFTHDGPEEHAQAAWRRMADFLRRVLADESAGERT